MLLNNHYSVILILLYTTINRQLYVLMPYTVLKPLGGYIDATEQPEKAIQCY
jgi:hypothetical protein